MARLVWPLALAATFVVGIAVGGVVKGKLPGPSVEDSETVRHLRDQIATLQTRLRAREKLAAERPPDRTSDAAAPYVAGSSPTVGRSGGEDRFIGRSGVIGPASTAPATDRAAAGAPARVVTATVQAALDRFYTFVEATNGMAEGRERYQQYRELLKELKEMGSSGAQALMQVLASGADTEERRTAARLLGQLQTPEALPIFKSIIENENDLLLRRAAASGLRQLKTAESVPFMERIVHDASEDRFVRLSAAVGLADANKPLGVTGLTSIFIESTADGRGRELAFRALANLNDDRAVPFMRQVVAAQVEPAFRLRAIRFLTAQDDKQAMGSLQVIMNSPNEQQSIRDAAAQAFSTLSAK
jgi:hypothetical protein